MSSFGRFRQSCRCMKLENSRTGLTRGFIKPAAEGRWDWMNPICLNNGIKICYWASFLWTVSLVLVIHGVFHWQPAAFKIAKWWKEQMLLLFHLWCAYFVSFHPLQAASLPMSIIIVGVGPAEFDGKQGVDHVHVCVHSFVYVCLFAFSNPSPPFFFLSRLPHGSTLPWQLVFFPLLHSPSP